MAKNENQGNGRWQKPNPIEIQKFLGGLNFPVKKQDIINKAKEKGADQNVISALEMLPDREYGKPTDISEAIGDMT